MRINYKPTPNNEEKLIQKRIKNAKSLSSEYQLGVFIGKYLLNYIPTLSTDTIQNQTVKEVSKGESDLLLFLTDQWFNLDKGPDKDSAWEEYREFQLKLEDKYLPKTLDIVIDYLNIHNEEKLKKGIMHTLWYSDNCYYSIKPEDIEIINKDYILTVIKLKYNKNK